MPDPDIKIKVTREGVEQAANDLKKLERASKDTGDQVEKLTTKKSKFIDAVKKGTREVPVLGTVISALGNPFTVLAGIVALASNVISEFGEEVNRLQSIIGGGSLPDQLQKLGQIIGESKDSTKRHAEAMAELANEVETVEKMVARLNRQLEIRLKLEGDILKATNQDNPNGDRARELRQMGGRINNLTQGFFRARDIVREGESQRPAMQAELDAAKRRAASLIGLADYNTTGESGRAEIQKQIDMIDNVARDPASWEGVKTAFKYGKPEDMIAHRAALVDQLAGVDNRNKMAGELRARASGDLQAAQDRFNKFDTGILTARKQMNDFATERAALEGEMGATRNAFQQMGVNPGAIGPTFDPRLQKAFEEGMEGLLKSIERMFGESQRRVDALSKQAWNQSQNSQ